MQILEFTLSKEGDLQSSFVIPKSQVLVNYYTYNGHFSLLTGDKVIYVYNDAEKNYVAKKVAKKNNNNFYFPFIGKRKNRLCYVTLDSKGKPTKAPLVDSWKQNILLTPYSYVRSSPDVIITWGRLRKSKELVLVRLSIKGKKGKG